MGRRVRPPVMVLAPMSDQIFFAEGAAAPYSTDRPWPTDAARDPSANRRLYDPLTAREIEVLSLVCAGDSNVEIAERLGVGLATIKWHMIQILDKLGVARRTQAVALAVYLGLIKPDWLNARPRFLGSESGAVRGGE